MYARNMGWLLLFAAVVCRPLFAIAEDDVPAFVKPTVVYKVQAANERLEMIVNTSRILALDKKIAQVQVNNPEILELRALSPYQVQISAKTIGVTQINLWDENQQVYSIDVVVFGDARQLELILRTTFPNAALKVVPVANSVLISGFVDKPEHVERIVKIAEEYYPKVINNMAVGGCQQVLLHVKVMEVSRTKLRQLGFDWAKITGSNVITSGPSGLLSDYNASELVSPGSYFRTASPSTFSFSVVNGSSAFFGVLEAMRQDNLMKILSEPTLVTVSGRPASFNSGGEIPVPVPQSLGTLSIEWKKYGTHIEFVPIVLGNGKIRLEVRPRISELDETRSFNMAGTQIPGIKSRDADTGVELQAGQTLAIAGLVQTRIEAENSGLPWISEVPYLGAAFRSVKETRNEVELLILVTPELVDPLDAEEVPRCGPGMSTTSPTDWQLFMRGHLEVPNCLPPEEGPAGGVMSDEIPGEPPEGMILGPGESIPAPVPVDEAGRPVRPVRNGPGSKPPATAAKKAGAAPYGRYSRSSLNSPARIPPSESAENPPGMVGPVGYDIVK